VENRNFLEAFSANPEIVFLTAQAGYWKKRVKDHFFDFFNHFCLVFCLEKVFKLCSEGLRDFLKYVTITSAKFSILSERYSKEYKIKINGICKIRKLFRS